MQLVLASVWWAPTGVSYKQIQKYRVFIIMSPSIIFMVGFSLNSIHILEEKTMYMGEE